MNIKTIIKKIFPASMRRILKRERRKLGNRLKDRNTIAISIDRMRDVLVADLGVVKGDAIIVASSFANLKANFTPQDLVELLMEIVTEEGVIMMPYYPPGNSTEWATKGEVFDMKHTKSSMGILTNVFSKMDGVVKSIHPTKAVCVWGKNAKAIVEGHEASTTPFYWDSPYGKLMKLNSKSIGIGLKNIPIFHTFEDVIPSNHSLMYQKNKVEMKVVDGEKLYVCNSYVHNGNLIDNLVSAGDFVRDLKLNSYRRINLGYAFCYSVENNDLLDRCKSMNKQVLRSK